MVVGIFPDAAALGKVVDGLRDAGVDLERLRVLACDEIPTELATTGVQYVWIGDVNRPGPGGIMTDGGGTSVPDTGGGPTSTGIFDGEVLEELSELAVPDGRTDEYARAVECGSLVVGYPNIGVDAETLRSLYSASGATSVEEF